MKRPNLINSETVFIATLIVVFTTSLIVYSTGMHQHRPLYLNSLISTSILSVVFLTFITIGLYNGWKLKDNLGDFRKKFRLWKKPSTTAMNTPTVSVDIIDEGGVEGCIISLVLWIIIGLFGSIIFWWLGAVVWAVILMVAGVLYWIIFRAYRLIFRNSPRCKGDLLKSFGTALLFTCLYNCWIYAIILGTHFLNEGKFF